jgi:DNA-binding response OmpR family regulator
MQAKKHILLAEDDESMGFLLQDSLENYGYQVTHEINGEKAFSAFQNTVFDICLLDVMMPKMDGFTLAGEIRKMNLDIPIIFLTAKSLKEDRINGFKIGADDYVTKPFSVEELSLRIQAIFKRGNSLPPIPTTVQFGKYALDAQNLTLITPEEKIQLTQKEMDILDFFVSNPNTLLRRNVILNAVWKEDGYFVGRSLDVFISKLRKHFKNDNSVEIINIHGSGYKFQVKA